MHGESRQASPGGGRSLASPGRFAHDDGAPDLTIRNATDVQHLLAALHGGRLLVAVTSTVTEHKSEGGDKASEMSVVSMVAADGRRGLLAFTGLDSLESWNREARPVPVTGMQAAQAAVADGCEAIVIDVAGPCAKIVPEVDVVTLAGIDALEHARSLTQDLMDATFGPGFVAVAISGNRLQVHADQIGVHDLAGALPVRAMALVPEGIEVGNTKPDIS